MAQSLYGCTPLGIVPAGQGLDKLEKQLPVLQVDIKNHAILQNEFKCLDNEIVTRIQDGKAANITDKQYKKGDPVTAVPVMDKKEA